MNNKISKNREKKEKIIAEFAEKVKKAKAMVFANYQGMTHVQLEQLKRAVKTVDAEFVVTKNTLLKKALEAEKVAMENPLEGATTTLFAYSDVVLPLKELAKVIKNLKLPEIKFGLLDGKIITAEEILKLSTLPSREVLLTQLVIGLKSPIFGLHRALNWNMQKFVMTLKAIEAKKGVK